MKALFCLVFLVCLVVRIEGSRRFCLEQLQNEYGNNSQIVLQNYEKTGENKCFKLKSHVARCMDKSLYSLIKTIDNEMAKSQHPYITLSNLEREMRKGTNVDNLPGFVKFLERCSHQQETDHGRVNVIDVGDFSRRCECDLGSDQNCRAYEHIRGMFYCGAVPQD